MKIGNVDTRERVLIIAEIGNNHEGDFARAEEMIKRAAKAGADVVKFQTMIPDRLVTADQLLRLETLRRFEFSETQYQSLAATARERGMMFMSTPFALEAVSWLDPLVPAFKISSSDNDWVQLLRVVAATGKPIILSTGMASLSDIVRARDVVRGEWRRLEIDGEIGLLHCVVSYPTPPESANLSAIPAIASLGETVGYSDHVIGIDSAVAAVALGARIIEKHFTLDKNLSAFRDHQLSTNPEEFAEMVKRIRLVESMRGGGEKKILAIEETSFNAVRRGAYAAHDLAAGATLSAEDVIYLRPRSGLSPADIDRRIGQRLCRPIAAGAALSAEDFS